jgi:apolipoprotein D and lipocalin family protein
MKTRTTFAIGVGLGLASVLIWKNRKTQNAPLATVPSVDLDRYLGTWYEIAKMPQRYERNCRNVFAEYTKHPDGYVIVHNWCEKSDGSGKINEIYGKAFPVQGGNNSKLKVQFFWPFKGDYWIIELDKEYQFVMVGSPDRKSLWILSRTKTIDDNIFTSLIESAFAKGFPTEVIMRTEQNVDDTKLVTRST